MQNIEFFFCRFCGKKIPYDSDYCQYCGKNITLTTTKKDTIIDSTQTAASIKTSTMADSSATMRQVAWKKRSEASSVKEENEFSEIDRMFYSPHVPAPQTEKNEKNVKDTRKTMIILGICIVFVCMLCLIPWTKLFPSRDGDDLSISSEETVQKPDDNQSNSNSITTGNSSSSALVNHTQSTNSNGISLKGYNSTGKGSTSHYTSKPITETDIQKPTMVSLPMPASGTVFIGANLAREGELTIRSSSVDSYYIKLKASDKRTDMFSFFVRAGETVTVDVPKGMYYVYFACGRTWYGEDNLFGESTSYSMDAELLDFSKYTWEYTLYPVTNGNFSETIIGESEF